MSTLMLYGFEDADGNESGTYTTLQAHEAKKHAMKYGLRVVEMEYEYTGSTVVWEWDFTDTKTGREGTMHTPGPWQVAEAIGYDDEGTPYRCIFSLGEPGATIAPARAYGETENQIDSNARLIAAAPQLVAALEACLAAAEQRESNAVIGVEALREYIAGTARAALAAARGEA